jgi:hypothetical protein
LRTYIRMKVGWIYQYLGTMPSLFSGIV